MLNPIFEMYFIYRSNVLICSEAVRLFRTGPIVTLPPGNCRRINPFDGNGICESSRFVRPIVVICYIQTEEKTRERIAEREHKEKKMGHGSMIDSSLFFRNGEK